MEGKLCSYEGQSGKIYRIRLNGSGRIVRARDARFIEEQVDDILADNDDPIREVTFKDVYYPGGSIETTVFLDHAVVDSEKSNKKTTKSGANGLVPGVSFDDNPTVIDDNPIHEDDDTDNPNTGLLTPDPTPERTINSTPERSVDLQDSEDTNEDDMV
jgi:hypothetical protein